MFAELLAELRGRWLIFRITPEILSCFTRWCWPFTWYGGASVKRDLPKSGPARKPAIKEPVPAPVCRTSSSR